MFPTLARPESLTSDHPKQLPQPSIHLYTMLLWLAGARFGCGSSEERTQTDDGVIGSAISHTKPSKQSLYQEKKTLGPHLVAFLKFWGPLLRWDLDASPMRRGVKLMMESGLGQLTHKALKPKSSQKKRWGVGGSKGHRWKSINSSSKINCVLSRIAKGIRRIQLILPCAWSRLWSKMKLRLSNGTLLENRWAQPCVLQPILWLVWCLKPLKQEYFTFWNIEALFQQ